MFVCINWFKVNLILCFQLSFQVEHGYSHKGYAALDSVSFNYLPEFRECPVLPAEAGTSTTNTPYTTKPQGSFSNCNFEVDKCGWIPDTYSKMAWFISTVKDLENMGYDGPKENCDGCQTHFMYVSAKDGNVSDVTTLSTDFMDEIVTGCMEFQFNIFVSISFTL